MAEEFEMNTVCDVPEWIEQDIDNHQVQAILQGGCASGAYMPAVTYWQAARTMAVHGEDVLEYIEEVSGEAVPMPEGAVSWDGLACHFLSIAVELWASSVDHLLELD